MRRDAEYTAFVEARSSSLLRLARLLSPDWATAEDVLQTALVKLYVHWPKVRSGGAEAYARRCVVTSSIDDSRRPWRREQLTAAPSEGAADDPQLDRVDRRVQLVPALAGLPPRQRAAVVLRYYLGLSEGQAAEILGCNVGTVKSNASRGLTALRQSVGSPVHAGDHLD